MEFFGTLILSLSINLSTAYSSAGQNGNWLLIFAGFFTAVTWTREISGGHLNPSVSTAVYFSKEYSKKENNFLVGYYVSQILGATTACLLSFYLYEGNIFQLKISNLASPSQAFLAEVISTFFFVYCILCHGNATSKLFLEKSASSLIIAFALFASASVAGGISGGCLNPAIGIAHNFTRFFIFQDFNELSYLWLYVAGPLTGGLLSVFVYNSFYENYFSVQDNKSVPADARI